MEIILQIFRNRDGLRTLFIFRLRTLFILHHFLKFDFFYQFLQYHSPAPYYVYFSYYLLNCDILFNKCCITSTRCSFTSFYHVLAIYDSDAGISPIWTPQCLNLSYPFQNRSGLHLISRLNAKKCSKKCSKKVFNCSTKMCSTEQF